MRDRIKRAIARCAEAHHCEYTDMGKEVLVKGDSPALICDLKLIARAFFGRETPVWIETTWRFTTVVLIYDFLDEVDEDLLRLALPYGTEI